MRGVVPAAAVDGIGPAVALFLQQRAGPGVGKPAREASGLLAQHKFDAVRLAAGTHEVVGKVFVHREHGARLVVEIVVHTLIVTLKGYVQHVSEHRPVSPGSGLPALLRQDILPGKAPGVHRRNGGSIGNQMDKLVHRVRPRLQGEVGGGAVFGAESQFRDAVDAGRAERQEAGQAQAVVKAERAAFGLPLVARIDSGLEGRLERQRARLYDGFSYRAYGTRRQGIENRVPAEGQGVGPQTPLVHSPEESLTYVGAEAPGARGVSLKTSLEGVGVLVVARAHFQRAARLRLVLPFQGHVEVGVTEGRIAPEREAVARPIRGGFQAVAPVETVRDAQIHVAERCRAARVAAVTGKLLQQPVGVRGAAAEHEAGLAFHDGALERQVAGQQADAQRAVEALGVAVPRADIQDR